MSPIQGSYNPVFAAASKRVAENKDDHKGVYLQAHPTGTIAQLGNAVTDEKRAKSLWDTTECFLKNIGMLCYGVHLTHKEGVAN